MKQDDRLGFWIWGLTEEEDITVWAEATDDAGAGRSGDGMALVAGRDLAVIADADAGLLAPDVRPPRTLGGGADDGAWCGKGLLLGRVRGLAQFAVEFMLVGVRQELIEQLIGAGDLDDAVGRQEWDQAFLPVVVAAFDLAFGLGRGRVEQFDAVEVEGLAELGEGLGVVGVEEGVVVHVERQGQAVVLEDAGKEVEVGQQGFGGIEAGAGVEAGGVVEDVEENLFVGAAGQESVGCGVVLPEGAVVAGLPALDGFGRGFVAGVGSELVFEGPAADAGAVGVEVQAAMQFAGDGAVRARRFGGEELGGQRNGLGGPLGMVIAAGTTRRPGVGVAAGAGAQVVGVEFVEAGTGQTQFAGGSASAEVASAMTVEEVADERSGQTFDQLRFFIGPKLEGEGGFFALELTPAGAGPVATLRHRVCRLSGFRRRSGCVPAEPYPPLKQPVRLQKSLRLAMAPEHYSGFDRTTTVRF
jgi:hypothetical protein